MRTQEQIEKEVSAFPERKAISGRIHAARPTKVTVFRTWATIA